MTKNAFAYCLFLALLTHFNESYASNSLLEPEYSGATTQPSAQKNPVSMTKETRSTPKSSVSSSSSSSPRFLSPRAVVLSLLVPSAELPSDGPREIHTTAHYFESMTQEDRRTFLEEMYPPSITHTVNYFGWNDLESKDSATVEAAQIRWNQAEKALEEGDWCTTRGVIDHLNDTKKFSECKALIERLVERPEDGASNCALMLMLEGYSLGIYGFEKEEHPLKMAEIIVSRVRQGHKYAKTLFYEGMMNSKYGISSYLPNNLNKLHPDEEKKARIEEHQSFIFEAAEQGDKEARRIIVEGLWCGFHSFFKNLALARFLNDSYCRTEMHEPFDWKLHDGSAIIRKITGLRTSKSSDRYGYVGNKEALSRFFEKLIQKGTPELKAFATAVRLGLVEEKARKRERIRSEIERYMKTQEEISQQFNAGKLNELPLAMYRMSYEANKKFGKLNETYMKYVRECLEKGEEYKPFADFCSENFGL